MSDERLLERFLRYVAVDTTAVEGLAEYPSSPGQLELGRLLADELREMGAAEVEQDEHGLVWAHLPATAGAESSPAVAFNSHVDTSPETTGANVRPQIIRDYAGGDIPLPAVPDRVITVADNPDLESLHGCTLITTDGSTLLGGDDKAGVAVIMELVQRLLERPELPHPRVEILFTCDEEIGRGVDHVDTGRLQAVACYTLDGGGAGVIDIETFSADLAEVTVRGVNIHPSIGKDRMVNALRAAAAFVNDLPAEASPERTDGRDGFLHPYHVAGGVAEVFLRVLLRSFDDSELRQQAERLRQAARTAEAACPGATVEVRIREQYRNMAAALQLEPRAVRYAELAFERLDRSCRREIIRGGTDGSQLSARGLPTPNLATGQHNPHSPLEWACLDEMRQAVEVLQTLVAVWAEDPGA